MKNPRYSVVIPTFNTHGVLNHCLEALCHQSVDKDRFEVIVVNDGGETDPSGDILSKKDQVNLRYFHQEHKGPAAARNLGIEKARGDIILFLDDDSLPTPQWLEATMAAWDKYSEYDGIGGYILSTPKDSIYCRVNADFFNWYLDQQSLNGHCSFLLTCNAGYKKTILNKIERFDEWFRKAAGEDRDLNIKISNNGGRLRLDRNILVYHDRDLTFMSFVRKNYNYGKAAYNIYTRYPEQKYLSANSYFDLYDGIVKRYEKLNEKFMVFSLITLSQICTAVGYYSSVLDKLFPKSARSTT